MNIDTLTIAEARQIAALFNTNQIPQGSALSMKSEVIPANPFEIGGKYFIRTVTHHYTGRLIAIYAGELVFDTAAWIADDGRLSDSLKSCEFNEVEPYTDKLILGRSGILDAVLIKTLPVSQK